MIANLKGRKGVCAWHGDGGGGSMPGAVKAGAGRVAAGGGAMWRTGGSRASHHRGSTATTPRSY